MARGKVLFRKEGNVYFVDDKEVPKEVYEETFPSKIDELLTLRSVPCTVSSQSKAWPRVSDSMGVHPDQIPEARELMKKHGVPTDYNAKGQAIVRDNAHQRDMLKAMGMRNHDGGYGDVTG